MALFRWGLSNASSLYRRVFLILLQWACTVSPNLEGILSFLRPVPCMPLFFHVQERLKALAAMAEAKRSSATSAQSIAARQAAAEAAAKWKHGDSARVLFLSFELPAGERASPVRVFFHTCLMLCHSVKGHQCWGGADEWVCVRVRLLYTLCPARGQELLFCNMIVRCPVSLLPRVAWH